MMNSTPIPIKKSQLNNGIKHRLIDLINKELDSLRFYYLGSNWRRRIEHVGAKKALDQEGPMVV